MEQIELKAEPRQISGKHVKQLRAEGYVPAVLYGSKIKSTPIQIASKPLQKALAQAGGNTLISLQVGDKKPVLALAREVQRDTLRHHILHADFYQVVMTEKITVEVPLVFVGDAPAVKDGGILVHGLDAVEVQCLPADVPHSIEVDLSSLTEFHSRVAVADLHLPPAVTMLSEPESLVAHIEAPRKAEEEEEEEVVEEAVAAAVEPELVARREKKEEEEEEED
jgi:large subunit ribosomal protein L25